MLTMVKVISCSDHALLQALCFGDIVAGLLLVQNGLSANSHLVPVVIVS